VGRPLRCFFSVRRPWPMAACAARWLGPAALARRASLPTNSPAAAVSVAVLARSLERLAPSLGCASSPLAVGRRGFCDGEVPKYHARYPERYFDFKAFRSALKEKKDALTEAELREIRREYAPPPPEGWTVLHFLETMDFGDGAEDVANLFERWEDFISMTARDITRIPDIAVGQRRKLDRHITLFNHGLWPKVSNQEFFQRFGGKPLQREAQPWTPEEDRQLHELARLYDAEFGDPWIYLSWEMQRREDDVRDRYMELVVKPRERATQHELAITKASRPLHMHRKFRMIPPDLYIVPSEENFPLAQQTFQLPAAFRRYRKDQIF